MESEKLLKKKQQMGDDQPNKQNAFDHIFFKRLYKIGIVINSDKLTVLITLGLLIISLVNIYVISLTGNQLTIDISILTNI